MIGEAAGRAGVDVLVGTHLNGVGLRVTEGEDLRVRQPRSVELEDLLAAADREARVDTLAKRAGQDPNLLVWGHESVAQANRVSRTRDPMAMAMPTTSVVRSVSRKPTSPSTVRASTRHTA